MIRLQHDIWKAVCMQDVRCRDVDHYINSAVHATAKMDCVMVCCTLTWQ